MIGGSTLHERARRVAAAAERAAALRNHDDEGADSSESGDEETETEIEALFDDEDGESSDVDAEILIRGVADAASRAKIEAGGGLVMMCHIRISSLDN